MLATNTQLEVGANSAAFIGRHLHNRPDPGHIKTGKWVFFHNTLTDIGGQKTRRIIAADTQRGLRQIIRAEREEHGFFSQRISHHGSARHFNHRAKLISRIGNAIFSGQRRHQRLQNPQFGGIDNQGKHNLDRRFALIGFHRGKNRAQLHGVNFRRGDAQTATAMTQHRIALDQFTNAPAQLFLGLPQSVGQRADIIISMGQKFMQGRVEQANGHRSRAHSVKQAGEIIALHRHKLCQCFFARRRIGRQNHFPHQRNALRVKKHMLGATQANPLSPKAQRARGIASGFRIGANTHCAAGISPCHQRPEIAGQFGFQCRHSAQHDAPRCAINRDDIALFQFLLFDLRGLAVIINMQLAGP